MLTHTVHARTQFIQLVGVPTGAVDARGQLELVGRLGNEIVDATIERDQDARGGILCGKQHDAGVAVVVFIPAPDQVGHLQPVPTRHPEIGENHVRATLVQHEQGFVRRGGGADVLVTGFAQSGFDDLATELQVIDDDDGEIFFTQRQRVGVTGLGSSIDEISFQVGTIGVSLTILQNSMAVISAS